MSDEGVTFTCHQCGGTVRMTAASKHMIRVAVGMEIMVPDEIEILKCDGPCADVYFNVESGERAQYHAFVAHVRALEAERELTRDALNKARCAVGMQAGVWRKGDDAMQQLHRALLALEHS
jgi:hypothetical protein